MKYKFFNIVNRIWLKILPSKLLSETVQEEIWSGNYMQWEDAITRCTGYSDDLILNKCLESLLKVKNGEATYERDSVLFDKKQYSTGLLSGLFLVALNSKGRVSVLDFGGSFGSSYYQNKEFFNFFTETKWGVVEQQQFVNIGKMNFKDEILDFFKSISQCIKTNHPNIFLASASIQYIPDPENLLKEINMSNIRYIILDRTAFTYQDNFLSIQKVPNDIYKASYPSWFFKRDWLINQLNNYKVIFEFPSYCDSDYTVNKNVHVRWGGLMLELK